MNEVIVFIFSLNFILESFKQFARFFDNIWTPLLTLMEKLHLQNFVKVSTVIFEMCKVETSYNLYSACINYLALKNYKEIAT